MSRGQWQAQAEPHGAPGPDGEGAAPLRLSPEPLVAANTDKRRLAPGWPAGQVAGAPESAIARRSSNTASHSGQRNS